MKRETRKLAVIRKDSMKRKAGIPAKIISSALLFIKR